MSTAYPYQDFDGEVRRSIQGLPSKGGADDWLVAMLQGIGDLDTDVGDLARGLQDIEQAWGPVLDVQGDLLREPRGGLTDTEYRRILAGRLVARQGVTMDRVWAGWLALTGSTAAAGARIRTGKSSVYLTAPITFVPSPAYRVRAGGVVRKLVGADAECNATVWRSTRTARFDDVLTPFGSGIFATTIFVQGAPA